MGASPGFDNFILKVKIRVLRDVRFAGLSSKRCRMTDTLVIEK